MIFFSMSKGTKSFGHDKALACESRGFVYNKKGCIVLTHPLILFGFCFLPLGCAYFDISFNPKRSFAT